MARQIYPTELQLNKTNPSDTGASFLNLDLSITKGIVSTKIFDKRDDFNFKIVNVPFFDGEVPRSLSMVCTFRDFFVLQEYVLMLMTSTIEIVNVLFF